MLSSLANVLLLTASSTVWAQSPSASFDGADWIWSSEAGAELTSFEAGPTYFRAELNVPRGARVSSAEVIVTADNLFALHINGKGVGESAVHNNAWGSPRRFDIASLLVPGRNVFAVEAVNTLPGPAGLLFVAVVRLDDGREIALRSNESWRCNPTAQANWRELAFEDGSWSAVRLVGSFGDAPWGRIPVPTAAEKPSGSLGAVHDAMTRILRRTARRGARVVERDAPADFSWPTGIVFVGDDCSLYRPRGATNTSLDSLNVTIFNPRNSRAFPEHDLPAPMKVGRRLYAITPARPDVTPRVLLDAGKGGLGSPSVSYDGASILFSMAREGDSFFHIYRLAATGGEPQQLTDGPFHDIDPAELPDGRVVFTSTRIGTFEEYHSPPSRALFVMNADGKGIYPITHTLAFDNEPEVLADGRIIFIRSDNFFDRGKVETRLHAMRPDGTDGQTAFGLEEGPEYGGRLRAFDCGSPAPMPDGRVAFVSKPGITVGRPGENGAELEHFRLGAGDVAALPDGRLLSTTTRGGRDPRYHTIGILDPDARPRSFVTLYKSAAGALHSPVFLGPRPRPPVRPESVRRDAAQKIGSTGYLFCQNVRVTGNTTAGWPHVRAVRVLAGKGLTVRSSHSYIVHVGSEVTELGTVPLAPDGSFYVEVPADTPIALQMVDAEGRSELNEMSWIYVRPGEKRGCIGCHSPRRMSPSLARSSPLALRTDPMRLLAQGDLHRFRGNNAAVTGLMELQFDRYRETAGLNRFDGRIGREVGVLIEKSRSPDAHQRKAAVQRLAIFRDPRAAVALAEHLHDRRRDVRVAAAVALAACGSRQSIEPLLGALSDKDPLVAQAAAVALENLTGHVEVETSPAFTKRREKYARRWRQWFAETDWKEIEAEQIRRLKSPDRDVVRRAAVALGRIGADAARDALRAYVRKNRHDNPLPAWRKSGHRGDAARFNSLSPVNPRTLQAATRSLGYLRDLESIDLLAEIIADNDDPKTGNLFLAEAAAEALGRMRSAAADAALVKALAALPPYPSHTRWYGDHDALMACHASPLHYFVTEALDARRATQVESIVPHLIRSVPIDPDRALFLENDDYEKLVGRVIRTCGAEAAVVETCLALLGDKRASRDQAIEAALSTIYRCWGGEPTPANRAAQVLSFVCRDPKYTQRVEEAFLRYRNKHNTIRRVFDTGIPVVDALPLKNWVCFYLARALGNLAQAQSADMLIATLETAPSEAATGRPDPLGVGVMFLHNGLTPCWRAAVAWALGRVGDRRAVPVLLNIVGDLDNAVDTRHAAVEALGRLGDPSSLAALRALADRYPEISTRKALLRTCAALSAQAQ